MSVPQPSPVHGWRSVSHNVPFRMGLRVGGCLSVVLVAWVIIANRLPFLERFAFERNLAAVVALGFFASLPILRFLRAPGNLLASSLVAWAVFSLIYRLLSIYFSGLGQRYSAFQIFMLGAVVYLIVVTLSWLGNIIWRARESRASHSNRHVS